MKQFHLFLYMIYYIFLVIVDSVILILLQFFQCLVPEWGDKTIDILLKDYINMNIRSRIRVIIELIDSFIFSQTCSFSVCKNIKLWRNVNLLKKANDHCICRTFIVFQKWATFSFYFECFVAFTLRRTRVKLFH